MIIIELINTPLRLYGDDEQHSEYHENSSREKERAQIKIEFSRESSSVRLWKKGKNWRTNECTNWQFISVPLNTQTDRGQCVVLWGKTERGEKSLESISIWNVIHFRFSSSSTAAMERFIYGSLEATTQVADILDRTSLNVWEILRVNDSWIWSNSRSIDRRPWEKSENIRPIQVKSSWWWWKSCQLINFSSSYFPFSFSPF